MFFLFDGSAEVPVLHVVPEGQDIPKLFVPPQARERWLRSSFEGQVFLDSDDVQNLDRLFGFPGRRTDTLVVLCTTSIILKPWCVGELSTAKLHDVDTILLVFPDFRWPTREFVKNYAQHMEGVLELAQYGSDVRLAREALRWLRGDEIGFRDEAAGRTCCSSPCGSSCDADVQGGRYRGHGGSGGSVCCTFTQGDARAPSSEFVGIGALDHS